MVSHKDAKYISEYVADEFGKCGKIWTGIKKEAKSISLEIEKEVRSRVNSGETEEVNNEEIEEVNR